MELDRVWIQAWAAALAIEAAAHLGTTAPDDVIEMSEMSTMVGRSPRDLARAEEALLAGRPDAALEHLAAHPTSGSALIRQHVLLADATARAQLAAGEYDEALRVAADGLAMAEKVGYGSEIWRLRTLVARGLEAVGDTEAERGNLRTARHEFDVLARRIADPDPRRPWTQPTSVSTQRAWTGHGRSCGSRTSVRAMTTNQIPGVPALVHGHAEASWGYGFSVIGHQRWPYFVGGLVPNGSASHGGAGGHACPVDSIRRGAGRGRRRSLRRGRVDRAWTAHSRGGS